MRHSMLAFIGFLLCSPAAWGQASYTWTNGSADSAWNTTSTNWTSGGAPTAWIDANAAVFSTTGSGGINVSGTRTVTSLAILASGYSFTGGAIALGSGTTQVAVTAATATIGSALTGANGLLKTGSGTLVLAGANSFTADTALYSGTLTLDYTANNSSKLSDTGVLTLDGGVVNLLGGSHTEIVGSTSLVGATRTVLASSTSNSPGTSLLQLGAISRQAGGVLVAGAFNNQSSAATTTVNTNGILGGWAVVFNEGAGQTADFATSGTSGTNAITRFTSYTALPASGLSGTVNYSNNTTAGGTVTLTASGTVNSLKLSDGRNMSLGGNSLTINSGGLLHYGNTSTTVLNGTLTAGAGSNYELIATNINGSNVGLIISATVADNGGNSVSVTKAGMGLVQLTGTNTYTGATRIMQGDVRVPSLGNGGLASTLGASTNATSNLVLDGGRLTLVTATTTQSTDRLFTLGPAGGTLDSSPGTGGSLTFANTGAISIPGAGPRTLSFQGPGSGTFAPTLGDSASGATSIAKPSGNGTWVLTGSHGLTGSVAVAVGGLTFAGASGGAISATDISVTGGTLLLNNATNNNADRIGDGATVTVSGAGAFALTGNASADTLEQFGPLVIDAGSPTITVTQANATRVATLAASSFSRPGNATALIRGSSLGSGTSATGRVTVSNTSGLSFVGTTILNGGATGDTTKTLAIIPYLVGDTSVSGVGGTGVTYDQQYGLRALSTANQYATLANSSTTAAVRENVRLTASVTLSASTLGVNSLLMNPGGTLDGTNTAFTIDSGAVITTASGTIGSGFSGLTLGNGTWNEGIVQVTAGTLVVNTPITITNDGRLTKGGAGTLVLNATSTAVGGLTINSGVLTLGAAGRLGTSGTFAGTVTGAAAAGLLTLSNTASQTFQGSVQAGGGITINGAGDYAFLGGVSTGASAFSVTGTNRGTISGSVTTGAMTLSAGNHLMTSAQATANGSVTIGAANVPATLRLENSALTTTGVLNVGPQAAGGLGALFIDAASSVSLQDNQLSVGYTGYGFMDVRGSFNLVDRVGTSRFRIGQYGGVGVWYQPSGTTTTNYGVNLASGGSIQTMRAAMYLTGSARLNLLGVGASIGDAANGGIGTFTMADDVVVSATSGGFALSSGSSVLNLNGGVLNAQSISGATGNLGYANFDGGTLQPAGTVANLIFANLTAATIYSGGLTIDTAFAVTVPANLTAPSGNGVATIPVADGGSGFIGAPFLLLGGDGGGASAVANMIDDGTGNGTYKVGSVTVTGRGFNYTSLTVSATGGGGTGLVFGTPTFAANVGGGLTKTGTGTMTLSGSNTYSGTTAHTAGTLALGNVNALQNSTLNVSSTVTFTVAGTNTYNIGGLAGTSNLTVGPNTLSVGSNGQSTSYAGILSGSAGVGLTKVGTGMLALTGSSTLSGPITIGNGTVAISSIGNSGTANPLGTSGTVNLGASTTTGTLRYTGGGETTTRIFNLSGTAGSGGAIEAVGSGALRLLRSGAVVTAAAGNKTLTLTGTSLGDNEIGVIGDPATSGKTALVKAGSGRWVLSGSNTFSGDVSVDEGQLILALDASQGDGSLGTGGASNAARVVGSAAGSGTAALLLKAGVTVSGQGITIPTGGAQTTVLGMVDAGTATFSSADSAMITLGRDVTLQAATGGTLVFTNPWAISASGSNVRVTVGSAGNDGTVQLGSSLATTGTIDVTAGTLRLAAGGAISNAAAIIVGSPNSLVAALDVTPQVGTYTIGSAQTLSGTGALLLDTSTPVSIAGFFSPGNSPGIFTFQGDGSGGTTTLAGTTLMEITGTTAGSGYDQVRFINGASLNYGSGSLLLDLAGIYADNTEFKLFDFAPTASGSFTTISGSGSYGLLSFVRGANGVWTSGSTSQPSQTFTFTESTGTLVVVPEPATLALAAVGIGLTGWAALRRRQQPGVCR